MRSRLTLTIRTSRPTWTPGDPRLPSSGDRTGRHLIRPPDDQSRRPRVAALTACVGPTPGTDRRLRCGNFGACWAIVVPVNPRSSSAGHGDDRAATPPQGTSACVRARWLTRQPRTALDAPPGLDAPPLSGLIDTGLTAVTRDRRTRVPSPTSATRVSSLTCVAVTCPPCQTAARRPRRRRREVCRAVLGNTRPPGAVRPT